MEPELESVPVVWEVRVEVRIEMKRGSNEAVGNKGVVDDEGGMGGIARAPALAMAGTRLRGLSSGLHCIPAQPWRSNAGRTKGKTHAVLLTSPVFMK